MFVRCVCEAFEDWYFVFHNDVGELQQLKVWEKGS